MAENKMAEILVEQAYLKGRKDFVKQAIEEIRIEFDFQYNDSFSQGINYAVDRVIEIIESLE